MPGDAVLRDDLRGELDDPAADRAPRLLERLPARFNSRRGELGTCLTVWLAYLTCGLFEWGAGRALTGALVTMVIPGLAAAPRLRPRPGRPVEYWVTIVAASLAALIAVALAAGATTSLSAGSLVPWLAAVTAALTWWARRATPVERPTTVAAALRRPGPGRPAPGRLALGMLALGVAAALVWTAAALSRDSAGDEAARDARTQVALLPVEESRVPARPDAGEWIATHTLSVTNLEGSPTTYRVEIELPGEPARTDRIELEDGATWTTELTAAEPGGVAARVWGGTGAEPRGYREVRTGVRE